MKYILDQKKDELESVQLIDIKQMTELSLENKRKSLMQQYDRILVAINNINSEIELMITNFKEGLMNNSDDLKEKTTKLKDNLEYIVNIIEQFNIFSETLYPNESSQYEKRLNREVSMIETKILNLNSKYETYLGIRVKQITKGEEIKVPNSIPINQNASYIKGFQEGILGMIASSSYSKDIVYGEGYKSGQEYAIKEIKEQLTPEQPELESKTKRKRSSKKTTEPKFERSYQETETIPSNITPSLDFDNQIDNKNKLIKTLNSEYDNYKIKVNGFELKGFEKDFFLSLIYAFQDESNSCVPISKYDVIKTISTNNNNNMLNPKEFYHWKCLSIGKIGENGALITILNEYMGYSNFTTIQAYREVYDNILGLIKKKIIFIVYVEYIDEKFNVGKLTGKRYFMFNPELLNIMSNTTSILFNFSRNQNVRLNYKHLENAYNVYGDLDIQIKILEKGKKYD